MVETSKKFINNAVSCFLLAKISAYEPVANQAGAYRGFCSMKRLGVFLLPPGWDASPSQGYPQQLSIYTPWWRKVL